MIRVKKVVGESFDLETGQGTNKGIVLVNDKGRTIVVEVTDEEVGAILGLMADERDNGPKPMSAPKMESRTQAPGFVGGADTVRLTPELLANGYYSNPLHPDEFGGSDYPETRAAPEDDYDPGETYGDSSSGLPSI